MTARLHPLRHLDAAPATARIQQRAHHVADAEAKMPEQRRIEFAQPTCTVFILRSVHLLEHIRVRADRALTEDDQAAREDIRAFHGDADRCLLIAAGQIIGRPHANALAAVQVHRIDDHAARALGAMVFDDGGDHRRFLAQIQRHGGEHACRIQHISVAADTRQCFFHALEVADRRFELFAHARIRTAGAQGQFGAARSGGRQRDGTPRRQTFHQHAPALADAIFPTDDVIERNEHVFARCRPVLECRIEREVAPPHLHARSRGGDQRQRDATRTFFTQQMIRVMQLERQTEQCRHRRQGDVALLPGEAYAQHILLPVEFAPAHDAVIGDRTRIGTGERPGQREARYFLPLRQTAQIFFFLLGGAVVQQQFCWPQRVGHHHRHCCRCAARANFGHHRRMRLRGEAQPAMLLGDDHAEETLVADELPHLRRQVLAYMGDVPIVQHGAQRFSLVVEEVLLFLTQCRLWVGQQLVPVRLAAEQVAIPPHRACIQRFLFGL